MKRYRLAPAAREDLLNILEFAHGESPAGSVRLLNRFRDAFRLIASRPGIGHRRDDLADEMLRVWPVFSYLVIYRPRTRPVQIVRVLHGARDVAAVMGTPGEVGAPLRRLTSSGS